MRGLPRGAIPVISPAVKALKGDRVSYHKATNNVKAQVPNQIKSEILTAGRLAF